jgi:signal transduction histidine kinase
LPPDGIAQKKQVEFQVAAECEVDVLMDKSKMKQVLINVLHNAIQHSPENSAITVELKRSSSGVNIMIRDEGKGFSEEQLAHLFERFYHDQQSTGLGLGLYISRRLVMAHQGILTAWNDSSGGACVEMMLPEK